MNAILARRSFLRSRSETIESLRDAHILEAECFQFGKELGLRQSAGDSAGPEIDVAANIIAEIHVYRYVGDLQPSSRAENPPDPSKSLIFLRN